MNDQPLYDVNVRGQGVEVPFVQGLYFRAALDTSIKVSQDFPNNMVSVRPASERIWVGDKPGYVNSIPAPLSFI